MRPWSRLHPPARLTRGWIAAGLGIAAALQLGSLLAAGPALATAVVPNVTVSAVNEWDEPTGPGSFAVHIVGEFTNHGPLPATDVNLAYNLHGRVNNVDEPSSVIHASVAILPVNSTAPFEDVWLLQSPRDTYTGGPGNPNSSISVGDAALFARPTSAAVRLPVALTSCPPDYSSDSICGEINNNTANPVEEPEAVISYNGSNGTIAAQNLAQAFPATLAAGETGHFSLSRTGDPCSGMAADPFAPCAAPTLIGEPGYPLDANPASLDFGKQVRGTTSDDVELTLTNNGSESIPSVAAASSSADFTVDVDGCASGLASGATIPTTCRITLQFTPSVAGARSGMLTLTDAAAGSPQTIPLSGFGAVPVAGVDPSSLSFGDLTTPVALNTSSQPQPVTLSNSGDGPLSISAINVSGDFALQSNGCHPVLDPAESCTIQVVAIPAAAGTRNGSLTLTDNSGAGSSPASQLVTLTAVGAGAAVSLNPPALHFGAVDVGNSATLNIQISNTGTAAFTLILSTSSDFTVNAGSCSSSLKPGSSCTASVTFTPSQPSSRSGTLALRDAAGDSFDSVPLDGQGAGAHTLSTSSIDFGGVQSGTASTRSMTVTNTGTTNLTVLTTPATPATDYIASIDASCPTPTPPQSSCRINVTFTPAALASRPGTLKINYQGGGSDTVSLSGTGTPGDSLGSTTVSAGTAATSWGPGRLDVFSRDAGGALIHNWWDGSWHVWQSLGGYLRGDPGAVSWGPNRIDVFVRGGDDQLWHRWWDGNAWSGWEPQGGSLITGPEVASWSSGRLDVFAVRTGGGLWHKWWDGVRWNGWESQGGQLTADPGAVSWGPNRIDVFARGTDNAMWHRWWDGVRWNGWELQGGTLSSAPAVASPGLGRLDILALDATGALMQKAWGGSGWSAWKSLGGSWQSDPAAVSQKNSGTLDVFLRAADNTLRHQTITP